MRTPGWEVKLAYYLDEHAKRSFRYGAFDCCVFAADAVRLLTGIDLMADKAYANKQQAKKLLRSGGGLEQIVRSVMEKAGFRLIAALHARRGDVVLADVPKPSVGIVSTDGWNVVFAAPKGTVRLPLSLCRLAWRIE